MNSFQSIPPLTPAQLDFLARAIPGFSKDAYSYTSAGNAGSDRRFVRVTSLVKKKSSVLIIWNKNDDDWPRFLSIAQHLETTGLLPRIYMHDADHGCILEEDLGAQTLRKALEKCTSLDTKSKDLYRTVMQQLIVFHATDTSTVPALSSRCMDVELFIWETDYFARHCVGEFFGCESLLTNEWEEERRHLATTTAGYSSVCVHRDFQSENIMVAGSTIRFVDFQGARRGPAQYDIASLLLDPYIPFLTIEFAVEMLHDYEKKSGNTFTLQSFYFCAMQRLMQALGAYGNLSIHKNKPWYRTYIPVALQRLSGISGMQKEYEYLRFVADSCLNKL